MSATATREAPFTVYQTRHTNGSTVRIRPSHTSVQRLHEGRYGFICTVTPMHDYADRTTSYSYLVQIDGEVWPYDHNQIEATGGVEPGKCSCGRYIPECVYPRPPCKYSKEQS